MKLEHYGSTSSLVELDLQHLSTGGSQVDIEAERKPLDPWDASQFPDGGFQAWSVLAGASCCLFCSFGWLNCWSNSALSTESSADV
jgi:hypothetical protein